MFGHVRSVDGRGMASSAFRVALVGALAALTSAVVLGAASAPASAAPAASVTISEVTGLEADILVELNAVRRAHGLTPLRRATPLVAAAATHSRAMASYGFFQHESRDGSPFWHRVQRFYGKQGFASWSVGENLLWSTNLDAARAVKLWMGSPAHRRNILLPSWREIGLSAVSVTRAPGHFEGRDVVIVTSNFGVRG
jgi:uncharacterized protein YkwD